MARGSVNKAILIGNLGADPEIRYTSSGQAMATFNIATNRQWTDRDGQKQEQTEWHRIVAWARLAEICERYLKKGDSVYIEGRIQTRQWEDREGNTRYTTEVVTQEMTMLGGGAPGGGQGGGGGRREDRKAPYEEDADFNQVPEEDDDIPF
ncbi:MAG: single-stranded DNA-binding protein [bacterium]